MPVPDMRKRALGLQMTVLARQIRSGFDERVRSIGVTRAKWMLIAAVASKPGATQREIAGQLEVTDVAACRLIDRACADGLIERRVHRQDRRAYNVALTQSAENLMGRLSQVAKSYEAEMFAGLDAGDLDRLDAFLERIQTNLCRQRPEAG